MGGTYVRLAVYSDGVQVAARTKLTKDVPNLVGEVAEFIKEFPGIEKAVFGIAGPVEAGSVQLVDVPHWGTISERDLETETGLRKVILLNDFVVNGYGILVCSELEPVFNIER